MNGEWRHPGRVATVLLGWLVVVFLIAPLGVVFAVSVTPADFISLPRDGTFSLRHYAALADDRWPEAALSSLSVGVTVAVLSGLIGTMAAIALWRSAPRVQNLLKALVLAPLIVPPVMIGLALYRPWVSLGLLDTWLGVVLAHTVLGVPLVFIPVSAALAGLDRRIDDAARSMGAGLLKRVRWIIVPNLKFGILSGCGLAFIASWDEFVITIFITQRRMTTLPLQLYQGIRDHYDPVIAAVAAALVALTLSVVLMGVAFRMLKSTSPERAV